MNQSTRIAIICLAVCTVLLSTAYSETCSFLDTCTQLESYSTSCGFWGWGSCTAYRISSYSCYKTSTCTYTLRSCGPCPVTCGNGTQYCTYECRSGTSCFLSDMIKIQSCNTQACPVVDGGWGLWASWTSECACSVTCGGGTNITTRKRYCDNPVPRNGGEQCKGISTDYQTFSCSAEPCPVQQDVNGNWSAWNGWTSYGTCSVTCGTGMLVQTRNRTCTNPIPQIGGRKCNGTSTESQTSECNTQACPVDGNWGAWNTWSSNATCSATCGGGIQIQTRNRFCTNPTPQSGGRQCNGNSTESQTIQCCPQICPQDGSWSAWNGWVLQGDCSVTCGEGLQVQTRNRYCTNPTPLNGGRPCNGTSVDSQRIQCMKQSCPVDGNWGAWNSWVSNTTCSVTCGTGVKTDTRNRNCSNPAPQFGGRQCNGTSVECQTILCNTTPCAIHGNWGAWSSWTSNATCSATCGTGVKTETRSRNCSNPAPQYGGRQCNGTSTENQTSACNTNLCPIDGNWGAWSSWTSNATCSVSCGTGVKTETRSRNCSNPVPQNGGRQCNGTSTENQTSACNTNLCPIDGNWGAWSSWTPSATCSVSCGTGVKTDTRSRTCSNPMPQNGGRQCNGTSAENQTSACNTNLCPIDGNWGAWSSWTSNATCSVTCGTGVKTETRNRTCSNPMPQNGGRQCNGTSTENQTSACNTNLCPIDGNWGAWSSWTSNATCSVTCGTGVKTETRNRNCSNPMPQNGGRQCNGTSTENQTSACNTNLCPIDGNWGAWSSWTSNATCSVTCGTGVKTETRNRTCSNPMPQNGGRQCNGTSTENQTSACNTNLCPIDGNWGAWSSWTSNATCSVTCGTGVKTETRNRTCSNPMPQNGGRQCNGTSTENQTSACNTNLCPIDGNWGAWSSWTSNATCSVTCGTGVKTETRNRTCSNPMPQNGGRQCNGTSTENQTSACNTNLCPIDGNWGAWSSWTSNATCSVTCGTGVKTETRNRTCSNPVPQNGGRQCNGTSTENQTSACNTNLCPIDGGWSAWTSWISAGTCNATCSGCNEIQTRNRTCTNPIPQNGGRQCNGTSNESQAIPCGSSTCPVVDGGWSNWYDWITDSDCSATCGGGTKPQRRTRTCSEKWPINGGRQCIGSSAETRIVQCSPQPCPPVDGRWGSWTSWTSSTTWNVTCSNGKQTRTRIRFCNDPFPQNCGRPCNGSSVESVVIQCNKQTCPSECNTSSEATVVCGPSSSGMNMNLTTSSNGGSGCNSINCTCAEITHGYVRHPTDCTKFIICAWNVQFVDSCKNGTYWDQRRLACRRGTC